MRGTAKIRAGRAAAGVGARLCVAALALAAAGGCATNPATGESQLSLVSEAQEVEMGREAARQIEQSGQLYEDAELTRYVSRIGQRLAAQSERPDLPWTFGVLDDLSINAFALPGGHIYLTRGILAHMENEAQLAGVLGHEIGHVTARHHASQATQSQLAQIGLGLGMILSPTLANLGGLAQSGLGLLLMSHSRDAEREADALGLRYMRRAAYEPGEMVDVLAMLDRTSQEAGAGRLPNWLSTHPAPQERIQRVEGRLAEDTSEVLGGSVARDAYLDHLEGMVYGPDPAQGLVVDERFVHPKLDFQVRFPEGWQVLNQPDAVVAVAPQQDAMIGLTLASEPSLDAAERAVRSSGSLEVSAVQAVELSGLPARAMAFRARTEQGAVVRGTLLLVAHEGRVFQLLGYAPDAGWSRHERVVEAALGSFGPLDPRYRDLEPRRLDVVATEQPMTLQEFDQRYPSSVPLVEIARLNQVSSSERLAAGTRVKRVVGGSLPEETPDAAPVSPVLGRRPQSHAPLPRPGAS